MQKDTLFCRFQAHTRSQMAGVGEVSEEVSGWDTKGCPRFPRYTPFLDLGEASM